LSEDTHRLDHQYRTPKGKDERLYQMPDRFKYLEESGVKCLKYGHTLVLQGGGYSTSTFDEIRKKQSNNESVVVAATGYPGKGKTYGVIRICQKLDSRFHINDIPPAELDNGQIAFSREHLDYLTGENTPLKRGQVIVIDEAHYGVGARRWGEREQQEVVDHIAAIRSKGFLLFLVVLHTEMIDKILRKFVFNYEFNFPRRGQAIAYRKYFPMFAKEPHVKRLGRVNLLLPDEQLCNALDCFKCKDEYLDLKDRHPNTRCMTIRAVYERRKEWFLNHANDKEETAEPLTYEEIKKEDEETTDGFYEYQHLLELNSRGTSIAPDSIKTALIAMKKKATDREVTKWKRSLDKDERLIKNIALRGIPIKEYPEDHEELQG